MKKFRFQLLHEWIVSHFPPCKVADIGGGKGLLTFLLNQSGFQSIVIDPYEQSLPKKFKDLNKQKHKISSDESIPRIDKNFIIFPCCVIDEPIKVKPNIDWFESLREYAEKLGHKTNIVQLNFRGQNKGIYTKNIIK